MGDIVLVSPLTPDECEARLRAVTDQEGFFPWPGSRSVFGRVSGRAIRLRKRIGYRNSFQTVLTGTLEDRGTETVFRGAAGMDPLVTVFMAVWIGSVSLIGGAAAVATVQAMLIGGGHPMGVAIPMLMAAFGGGMVWFGRWLARDEEAFLIAHVANAIDAKRDTSLAAHASLNRCPRCDAAIPSVSDALCPECRYSLHD